MGPSEALHREPVWLGWISDVIPKAAQANYMSQPQTAPTNYSTAPGELTNWPQRRVMDEHWRLSHAMCECV